ncbi:MAG: hypothetical protein WAW00_00260, partial [Candidatus Moraniibacteriota bacterium]
EGEYSRYFKQGFRDFSEKRCDKAGSAFRMALEKSNGAFVSDKYLAGYSKKCDELQKAGLSFDTRLDELKGRLQALGSPLFYLIGIGLVIFGIFGGALLWILRQVRREEQEIEALETRLYADEARIKGYQSLPRVSKENPFAHEAAEKKKKKYL